MCYVLIRTYSRTALIQNAKDQLILLEFQILEISKSFISKVYDYTSELQIRGWGRGVEKDLKLFCFISQQICML